MATNPATHVDIEARWRPLTEEEQVVASTLLDDAWRLLNRRIPTLADGLDADPATVDSDDVIMVLAGMVKRVLLNPDGTRQESIQDYSRSWDATTASGRLTVTDEDVEALAPVAADALSTAFTIVPAYRVPAARPEFDETVWRWAP